MKKIGKHKLYLGNCLKVLRKIEDNSIDSIVTDPPYGLKFMAKKWDHDVPQVDVWKECLRVLKPGGYLLAFAGTRTQHRMAVNIEDAGFAIVDMIAWCYASGFPKSLNISKAIDAKLLHGGSSSKQIKLANASRPGKGRERKSTTTNGVMGASTGGKVTNDNPATEQAAKWKGFGTAIKPAIEPITLARKPLEGTYVDNVLKYGVGGLNIDGCRIPHVTVAGGNLAQNSHLRGTINGGNGGRIISKEDKRRVVIPNQIGRFPANFIHDGSEEVRHAFPNAPGQQGDLSGHSKDRKSKGCYGDMKSARDHVKRVETDKSAARFFYVAKASKKDRDEGNTHITVKPRQLMRYLVRLVTPIGGTCLDPYMGSGTTLVACEEEGCYKGVGIELLKEHFKICKMRVRKARRLNVRKAEAVKAVKKKKKVKHGR